MFASRYFESEARESMAHSSRLRACDFPQTSVILLEVRGGKGGISSASRRLLICFGAATLCGMKRWLLAALAIPACALAQNPAPSPNPIFTEAVEAFKKEDYATARLLFEAVLADNPRDTASANYLKTIGIREKGGGGKGIEANLKKVIVPKVDFQDATVRDAITYVAQQVKTISGGKQTLNIVWLIPADYAARVTLSLQNVPAAEVMKYVAQSGNLKLDYDAYAVKVKVATP
jgi:hypothetical protein